MNNDISKFIIKKLLTYGDLCRMVTQMHNLGANINDRVNLALIEVKDISDNVNFVIDEDLEQLVRNSDKLKKHVTKGRNLADELIEERKNEE